MKPLLLILTLIALPLFTRADIAEVKRVMDEPIKLRIVYHVIPGQDSARDEKKAADALGQKPQRGVATLSPRELFTLAGQSQGRTSAQTATIAEIIINNAGPIRDTLTPVLNEAQRTELESAMKQVESSKTLDRVAQDRFMRLARIAQ